jgi:hypothetical protein
MVFAVTLSGRIARLASYRRNGNINKALSMATFGGGN